MTRIEHHDGQARPLLYCDVCGLPVYDAGWAMAAWRFGESRVYIAHKGDCLKRFERRFCPEGYTLATEELIAHLYYLARNYGLEAEEPAALRGIL